MKQKEKRRTGRGEASCVRDWGKAVKILKIGAIERNYSPVDKNHEQKVTCSRGSSSRGREEKGGTIEKEVGRGKGEGFLLVMRHNWGRKEQKRKEQSIRINDRRG